jgi:hypothetical protein
MVLMYMGFRRREGNRHNSPRGVLPLTLLPSLSNPTRLDETALAKLKTFPFEEKSSTPADEEGSQNYQTCAICIEDFREKEMIRELPCGHIYHVDCIGTVWAQNI